MNWLVPAAFFFAGFALFLGYWAGLNSPYSRASRERRETLRINGTNYRVVSRGKPWMGNPP